MLCLCLGHAGSRLAPSPSKSRAIRRSGFCVSVWVFVFVFVFLRGLIHRPRLLLFSPFSNNRSAVPRSVFVPPTHPQLETGPQHCVPPLNCNHAGYCSIFACMLPACSSPLAKLPSARCCLYLMLRRPLAISSTLGYGQKGTDTQVQSPALDARGGGPRLRLHYSAVQTWTCLASLSCWPSFQASTFFSPRGISQL